LAPRVFVDAFRLAPGQQPELLKWTATDTTAAGTYDYSYQVADDGQHLLRVQPELLAAGRYTLRLWRGPGLGLFPVKGRTDQAIGSFWGNERDGGARRHEGVDIFAPRGTPAVAATDGYITRTGESKLGGRVVWLADARGQHLYYAHLDKQLVQPGQHVHAGDTLGLVGNTGNARTTAPHLHFGIYRMGGAVDPWPFLHRADPVPVALTSPDRRGEWVRPRPAQANRHLPAACSAARWPMPLRSRPGGGPGAAPAAAVIADCPRNSNGAPSGRAGSSGLALANGCQRAGPEQRLCAAAQRRWPAGLGKNLRFKAVPH
jgi:murein DD-endopeptidase MepM/ murein hydrolase activator NlpD